MGMSPKGPQGMKIPPGWRMVLLFRLAEVSELFAGGVPKLDIWKPESAKLLPKNDCYIFRQRKKINKEHQCLAAPGIQSQYFNHPSLLSLGSYVSGQQQKDVVCATNWGALGTAWSSQSCLCLLTKLAPRAIEKDESGRIFLFSNEVQTQNSWNLGV